MTKARAARRKKTPQMKQEKRSQQLRTETEKCRMRGGRGEFQQEEGVNSVYFSESQGKYV